MKLSISKLAHDKIMHWVNKSDFEVSGFGKVTYCTESKTFFVSDAYLVKQENGSAHTDIDAAALGKLMYTTKDIHGDLQFWWHSHVNMSCFWSAQDRETINDLGKQGYIVASVFNKKNESRSAVCAQMSGPFGEQLTLWDDIPLAIEEEENPDKALWDAEYLANVSEKKIVPFDMAAWESANRRANRSILTRSIKTEVPQWARIDAELLGEKDVEAYYHKTMYMSYDEIDAHEEKLELAAKQKHGLTYDKYFDSVDYTVQRGYY